MRPSSSECLLSINITYFQETSVLAVLLDLKVIQSWISLRMRWSIRDPDDICFSSIVGRYGMIRDKGFFSRNCFPGPGPNESPTTPPCVKIQACPKSATFMQVWVRVVEITDIYIFILLDTSLSKLSEKIILINCQCQVGSRATSILLSTTRNRYAEFQVHSEDDMFCFYRWQAMRTLRNLWRMLKRPLRRLQKRQRHPQRCQRKSVPSHANLCIKGCYSNRNKIMNAIVKT